MSFKSSSALQHMAEDDWGDFEGSVPAAPAIAAAPVAAHSRPLPADLFSIQEASGNSEEFGDCARAAAWAPSALAAHEQAQVFATAPEFSKGQAVSYFDGRSGSWVPAKVGRRCRHLMLPKALGTCLSWQPWSRTIIPSDCMASAPFVRVHQGIHVPALLCAAR